MTEHKNPLSDVANSLNLMAVGLRGQASCISQAFDQIETERRACDFLVASLRSLLVVNASGQMPVHILPGALGGAVATYDKAITEMTKIKNRVS